jgi:hypothetical protein
VPRIDSQSPADSLTVPSISNAVITTTPGVLAPDSSFVIYNVYAGSCKKEIIVAQRINPLTGAKIGAKKTLLGCNNLANILVGFFGIDLIKLANKGAGHGTRPIFRLRKVKSRSISSNEDQLGFPPSLQNER